MNESGMMLAKDYAGEDVTGWYASEKLDGVRAYWDGRNFWSRGGNIIPVPTRILDKMPLDFHLDGELWAGRGNFEIARQAVQYRRWTDKIEFVAFDAPQAEGDFWQRLYSLQPSYYNSVKLISAENDLAFHLSAIKELGGEGIVLRKPGLPYIRVRTGAMLKLKTMDQLTSAPQQNISNVCMQHHDLSSNAQL